MGVVQEKGVPVSVSRLGTTEILIKATGSPKMTSFSAVSQMKEGKLPAVKGGASR